MGDGPLSFLRMFVVTAANNLCRWPQGQEKVLCFRIEVRRMKDMKGSADAGGVSASGSLCTFEKTARLLLGSSPLDSGLTSPSDPRQVHLVIVGFGPMGQAILLHAAQIGHYVNGRRLRVTVYLQGASILERSFRTHHPYLDEVCQVDFIQAAEGDPPQTTELQEWADLAGGLLTVAITIEDPSDPLRLARHFCKELSSKQAQVLVQIPDGGCRTDVVAEYALDAGLALCTASHNPGAGLVCQIS